MKFKMRHTVFYSYTDKETGKQHSEFKHFSTESESDQFVFDLFHNETIKLLIVQQDCQKEWWLSV